MKHTENQFIIGITGHRNPVDPDLVYQKSKKFFRKIQEEFPDKQLCIMSALAEGVDQICAEAALDCGAEVWEILPFREEEYLKDFYEDFHRRKYQDLKSRSARVIEIHGDVNSPERYFDAGKFIVEHCTMLLAVWDGCKVDRPGGTWSVIDCALNRHLNVPVIHLFTQRTAPAGTFTMKSVPENGDIFIGNALNAMEPVDMEKSCLKRMFQRLI